MAFELDDLVRENIRRLTPYSSARAEFTGDARVLLDANENSFGSPLGGDYHRYPDPLQSRIKDRIGELNDVTPSRIFVGNGSDEAIDLLFRVFCRPAIDNVIVCPPTYGMYEVSAEISDVAVRKVDLTDDFNLNVEGIENSICEKTKLIFFCSPNNPTGNLLERGSILAIARAFPGIVVVDEAYIDFSGQSSLVAEIDLHPNLVVLQTFSKAWGLAGLRVGLAFAREKIVSLLGRIKPPYNVSQVAQELILSALDKRNEVKNVVCEIVDERRRLAEHLATFQFVEKVYPSDANFLLVKTTNAGVILKFLTDRGIVVRDRSGAPLCEGCLRITVGRPEENRALLNALSEYEESIVH